MTDWAWDPSLFEGAAVYYERGRLPYAEGMEAALSAALSLDGSGRLLDLGCGPGTILLRLAHLYERGVGLDPDAGMIAEGRRLAAERGITNVELVERRAEAMDAGLGAFRTITFGQSLHWMDRERVFSLARAALEPGGVVVHVDTDKDPTTHERPPYEEIEALRVKYLGPERRAGRGVRSHSPDGEDEIFRAVGFHGPDVVRVPDGRTLERTADDVVAEVFSTSKTAPHLFGDRLQAFEDELRERLGGEPYSARVPDLLLKLWRPSS